MTLQADAPVAALVPVSADPHHGHLVDAPRQIKRRIDRHHPKPKAILDFGCGQGVMTLALALAYPDADVVGVDVHSEFRRAAAVARDHLGMEPPRNLRFALIAPGESLASRFRAEVVTSWSVMEHVGRAILPGVVSGLRDALTEDGIVFTQICPLYFSPRGSHLKAFIDEPWHHLLLSHDELRRRIIVDPKEKRVPEGRAWRFGRFEALNRITADELAGYFGATGLHLIEDTRRRTDEPVPPVLLQAFHREALVTEELVFVHSKAPPRPGARLSWPGLPRRRAKAVLARLGLRRR